MWLYLYRMLNIGQAYFHTKNQLIAVYNEREAAAIAHDVLEEITGLNRMDRLMQKDQLLSEKQNHQLNEMVTDLKRGKPLQYVLGYGWFMGRKYLVSSAVLIPRPETEELVDWIIQDASKTSIINLLDVGTGSGCIPVSLQLALPQAKIVSVDVSGDALEIARKNGGDLNIDFRNIDFLDEGRWPPLGNYQVIVSNPPYIPEAEKEQLHINVRNFEPSLALFVPDNDPFLFYKALAKFGGTHLQPGGAIYCELESSLGERCVEIFKTYGYGKVELRKDMHGNFRMLKAVK